MHFSQSKDKNLILDWLNSDSIKRIALKYNISETTLRRLMRKVLGKEEQHNFNSVMSNRIKEAYLKFEAEKNKNAQDYPLFSQINDITNKKEIKTTKDIKEFPQLSAQNTTKLNELIEIRQCIADFLNNMETKVKILDNKIKNKDSQTKIINNIQEAKLKLGLALAMLVIEESE